jgi:cell division protein FtsN
MENKKARFFIYDRREVSILVLLAVMVAVFAFTLGVHLGKRAGTKVQPNLAMGTDAEHKSEIAPALEATPTDEEIQARIRTQPPAAADLLAQATQEEVKRTGIKLDSPRQVSLPSSVEAGSKSADSPESPEPNASMKKYAIQIGSYPSLILAQLRVHELEGEGLKPVVIRKADVKGLGTRFRVMVGEFRTRQGAEKAGEIYRSEKKFDTFIIAPIQG